MSLWFNPLWFLHKTIFILVSIAEADPQAVLSFGGFASYLQVAACRVDFPMEILGAYTGKVVT